MVLHGLIAAWAALADGPGLPNYAIEPPDVLRVEVTGLPKRNPPVRGEVLVRPDGAVALGDYGRVSVAGLTAPQARATLAAHLKTKVGKKRRDRVSVRLAVAGFNSKCYTVVRTGAGGQEEVARLPVTGRETVLAAAAAAGDLAAVRTVWVARPTPNGGADRILPVDWKGITREGVTATNYQVLPGDRVFIKADAAAPPTAWPARLLAAVGRLLGTDLSRVVPR